MEEEYLTLAEIKEQLEKEQKERGELLSEQKLTLEHAKKFSKLSAKKAKNLAKELSKLDNITILNAVKIADLMPTHPDDLQAMFAKERVTITKEELEKVLEIVRKYV